MSMVAAMLLLLTETLPATIANPGFQRGLEDWNMTGHRGYRATLGSSYPARPRRRWLHAGWVARYRSPVDSEYRVFTVVDARRYRGRLVRLSAVIRSPGRGTSLDAVVEGTSVRRALPPSRNWVRQGVLLRVPRDAEAIQVGFHLQAGGSLEADDVRLDVVR